MKAKFILIGLSAILLSACNYFVSKDLADPASPSTRSEAQAKDIGFEKVFNEALKPRCLECHSSNRSAAGINVEDYNNVFANREDIRDAVATSRMPKNRPLMSAAEKELLFTWIDAGAPKEGTVASQPNPEPPQPTPAPAEPGTPPAPEPPSTTPNPVLNFARVQQEVLGPRCLKCHSEAGGNRGDLNFETFENVKAALQEISEEVSTDQMPPRKPLTSEEKSILLTWIQDGAPQ